MEKKLAPRNQGYRNGDNPRRVVLVETPANSLVVQDGIGGYDWSFQAEEGPTNIALMAYTSQSSSSSDSEVHTCSKDCLKSYETLQKQYDQQRETLKKSNLEIIGEGFHVVPPPYTGNYMPSRPDLSFAELDDSVYKTKVSETKTSVSKTSKDIVEKPKTVRPSAPIIEDWDTNSNNDSVFRPKSDQTKPKFTKINFAKSDENVKSVNKKNTHKQVEYPRKSQSPRGNRRNWNGMMTQKLGNGFEFIKKACFMCGSFNHLIKDCDFYDKKMVEKQVLNNKGRVTSQREIRTVWNNAQRVNQQNKFNHPHPKRNFIPTAVVTKSGQVPVNTAKQSSPRATTSISTARPVNTAAPKSKVNDALPKRYSYFKAHSPVRRAFNKKSAAKTNNFNEKVKTARINNETISKPKAVVSAACRKWGKMLIKYLSSMQGFRDQQESYCHDRSKTIDHTCLKYLTMLIYKADSSHGPPEKVGDEAVHKELGDKIERAATTASSLEAEQDSGSGPSTSENEEMEITATIDGRVKTVTKESIRRHLKLEDFDSIITLPNTKFFEQLALMRQETKVPQLSSPPHTNVADEAASTGVDVRHGGAATTITSLDAGQGSGNINKTPSMPCDSPLPRDHTLGSDEDRMQQNELMNLVIKLSDRCEALETELRQTKKVYGDAFTRLIQKGKGKLDKTVKISRTSIKKIKKRREVINVQSYTRKRRAVSTGSGEISTARESVSTAGASMPVSTAGMIQEAIIPSSVSTKNMAQGFTNAEWDNVLARVTADEDFVQQLQAGEKCSKEDIPMKLVELKEVILFKQLKSLSFEQVKEIFKATMRRVQSFVPMDSELEVQRLKRVGQEVLEKPVKRQKIGKALGSSEEHSIEKEKELSQEDLQQMMMVVLVEEVYVEALHVKYLIINWEIYSEETRRYWRIISVGNHTEAYQTFDDMLKKFNRDNMDKLRRINNDRFRELVCTIKAGPQDGPTDAGSSSIFYGMLSIIEPVEDNHDLGTGSRRTERAARECTYSDFLKCQPLNTTGAMTWWNSQVKTVGHDAAYRMPWKTLKKDDDSQILPKRVGTDAFENDAIEFAIELMDQKIRSLADHQDENKRKLDDTLRNNQNQQQPFERHNMERAYIAVPGEKKVNGHLARDYRSQPAVANNQRALRANQRGVTCFECGSQGHFKRDYPKLKNNNWETKLGTVEQQQGLMLWEM
ncbi:hypothetical protein Tco_0597439 [Tanacetum coccineum]